MRDGKHGHLTRFLGSAVSLVVAVAIPVASGGTLSGAGAVEVAIREAVIASRSVVVVALRIGAVQSTASRSGSVAVTDASGSVARGARAEIGHERIGIWRCYRLADQYL